MLARPSGNSWFTRISATQPTVPGSGIPSSLPAGVIPNRRSLSRQSATIRRYRGSKMCSGSGVPGKRTTDSGKMGSRKGMGGI